MELVWRAYNVITVPAGRLVLQSALVPGGPRVYRQECWAVPTHGERKLEATWYSTTSDFVEVHATEADLLKALAANGERMEELAREFMLAPPVRLDLGTDNGPNYEQV